MASNSDKAKNAQLAKEHPERVVNGIYYGTDEALAQAKAEYEKQIKKDSEQAEKDAKAEQQQAKATEQTINSTVYGSESSDVESLEGSIGGIELNAILGNSSSISERQKLLNFKTFVNDFKEPNPGKPPHNEDAFPVDQKIEEFESHQPTIKIHRVITHNHGKDATIAAMHTSDTAEKRIVRLENNMATVMRYLFRMGSRVAINCVYWGGSSVFNKYKCIRCLRDDRISDGQFMQIDQCLTCTKFEPIIGQVYEIMNDLGVGVAQILDDNQMGYMNNQEYIDLSRIENFQNAPKSANFDLSKVLYPQNGDEIGFKATYGEGIKVKWELVPVEEQKCHINWRQSINDDGSGLGRLGSWQDNDRNLGYNLSNPLNNPAKANIYLENQKSMESNSGNADYGSYISSGSSFTSNNTDVAKTAYMNDFEAVKAACGTGNDIDQIAVLAASIARGTKDYANIVSEYRQTSTTINSTNPALIWTAMCSSDDIIKMYIDGTLEAWVNPPQSDDGSGSSSSGDGDSGGSSTPQDNPRPEVKKIPAPNIIEHNWGNQRPAMGKVINITIHHAGGESCSVEEVHRLHSSGDTGITEGIGYHFYIEKDGSIHRGNPEEMIGAHTGDHNSNNLGVSLEGNYQTNSNIPDVQWQSLVSIVAYLCNKYSLSPNRNVIKGHREWSGHESNDCPGQYLFNRLGELCETISRGGGQIGSANALWTEFMPLVIKGLKKEGKTDLSRLDLFPKICYLYVQLLACSGKSSMDGTEWGFPFSDNVMQNFDEKKVIRTSPFGSRGGKMHEGVDMQPGGTIDAYHLNIPFCACKNGVVVEAADGGWADWHGISINHQDGTFSRYLHAKQVLVKTGQQVSKGDKIGYIGGWGPDGEQSYDYHLHLEMGRGNGTEKIGDSGIGINPEDVWKRTNADGPAWQL